MDRSERLEVVVAKRDGSDAWIELRCQLEDDGTDVFVGTRQAGRDHAAFLEDSIVLEAAQVEQIGRSVPSAGQKAAKDGYGALGVEGRGGRVRRC